MKERNFRFVKREPEPYTDCIDYLWFKIWRFSFRWFLDCGEWFLYLTWETKRKVRGIRFSGAGNIIINHHRGNRYE